MVEISNHMQPQIHSTNAITDRIGDSHSKQLLQSNKDMRCDKIADWIGILVIDQGEDTFIVNKWYRQRWLYLKIDMLT